MILFIDACARSNSRTRELAEVLLKKLGNYESVNLYSENIPQLNEQLVNKRISDSEKKDFTDTFYKYAKQFRDADGIVIAAPYWDSSFPASLKNYIEQVCVVGLTFGYSENGNPIGFCKAKKLYYVTTSGGTIYDRSFGFGYIQNLAQNIFGIKECLFFSAENLDEYGSDTTEIMEEAKKRIIKSIENKQ